MTLGNYAINTIHQGDCIEILRQLPDNSVDLIFADPPYNLQLQAQLYRPDQSRVDAVDDDWDKFESNETYDKFSYEWLKECHRILKNTGTIWVIGTYHNIFRLGTILQNLNFWLLNDVIWVKTNPMPNFKGTRFNNAHETLIWAAKNKTASYTFHYKAMKTANDDLQMRSDWYLPICQGKERIKINGQKAHSTQKPAQLLQRIILATSNVGDIVLDPFFGSGTTGAVAKRLGRNFFGIERETDYIAVANQRINEIVPLDKHLLAYEIEKMPPKVPFANLIEKDLIKIGEFLFSKDKQNKAVVNANASLTYQEEIETHTGSIHKISAKILRKETNNGWLFWYVERQGALINIDELRKEYIKKYINL
jgi:DNA modification methylase